jgi:phytoene synthase
MTPPGSDEGLRAAFAKAEAREPIHGAAVGFVPVESRAVFMAWVALLEELRECAFELSDPRVTAVKAGWWAEELDGVARGAARHPLTRALVRCGGPWGGVGAALLAVSHDDAPPADRDGAVAALRPLAEGLVRVEAHLFDAAPDTEAQWRCLAIHWLRLRLERGMDAPDRGRVPLALFARHSLRRDQLSSPQGDALRRDWAGQLREALPLEPPKAWGYPRTIGLHSDRRALARLAEGRPPSRGRMSAFLDVWGAWRCARNAALRTRAPASAST